MAHLYLSELLYISYLITLLKLPPKSIGSKKTSFPNTPSVVSIDPKYTVNFRDTFIINCLHHTVVQHIRPFIKLTQKIESNFKLNISLNHFPQIVLTLS